MVNFRQPQAVKMPEFGRWLPALIAVLIGCMAALFVDDMRDRVVVAVSAVVAAGLWTVAVRKFGVRYLGLQSGKESQGLVLLRIACTLSFAFLSTPLLLSNHPALLVRYGQWVLAFTAALAVWFILFGSSGLLTARRR